MGDLNIDARPGSIEGRIARLERANRWLIAAACLTPILLGGLIIETKPGPPPPPPLTATYARVYAQEFVVVGPSGQTTAVLGDDNDPKSGPRLSMFGRGKKTVDLGGDRDDEFAHLMFEKATGQRYVGLFMNKGQSSLRLQAGSSIDGISLGDYTDGGPYMILSTPDSRAFAQVTSSKSLGPRIELAGKDGQVFYEMPKLKVDP